MLSSWEAASFPESCPPSGPLAGAKDPALRGFGDVPFLIIGGRRVYVRRACLVGFLSARGRLARRLLEPL